MANRMRGRGNIEPNRLKTKKESWFRHLQLWREKNILTNTSKCEGADIDQLQPVVFFQSFVIIGIYLNNCIKILDMSIHRHLY